MGQKVDNSGVAKNNGAAQVPAGQRIAPSNLPPSPSGGSPAVTNGRAGAASRRGEVANYGRTRRAQIERQIELGGRIVGNTAKGIDADRTLPQRYRFRSIQPDPARGKTTVAAVMDTQAGKVSGTPPKPRGATVIRFDGPHRGSPTPHINLNPQLTGLPDPHTPISPRALSIAGGSARAFEVVGRVARPVAIVTDTVRMANAFHADGNQVGRNTLVTGGSVAGGWAGAAGGAWLGAKGGAAVGGFVGAWFGVVGAVPGAAIGGVIGGIAGGIAGAFAGSAAGETAAESVVN